MPRIEANKRLRRKNILAIAPAKELTRIAWSVRDRDRSFETRPEIRQSNPGIRLDGSLRRTDFGTERAAETAFRSMNSTRRAFSPTRPSI